MANGIPVVIDLAPHAGFAEGRRTVKRALCHIEAGHPVHWYGGEEFTTADFIACLRSEIQDDSRGIKIDLAAGKGIWTDLVRKREYDDE
ncbi:MAG: hypothetical protein HY343_12950 [Lentisphaerae bacterium]|nr:hypothetical protein [Lentisphaerota bacterium]